MTHNYATLLSVCPPPPPYLRSAITASTPTSPTSQCDTRTLVRSPAVSQHYMTPHQVSFANANASTPTKLCPATALFLTPNTLPPHATLSTYTLPKPASLTTPHRCRPIALKTIASLADSFARNSTARNARLLHSHTTLKNLGQHAAYINTGAATRSALNVNTHLAVHHEPPPLLPEAIPGSPRTPCAVRAPPPRKTHRGVPVCVGIAESRSTGRRGYWVALTCSMEAAERRLLARAMRRAVRKDASRAQTLAPSHGFVFGFHDGHYFARR
ncbi:hypothetical protein EYR40_007397 [Pleurotus pulmonarius]|nr:hypothetical protein EYR36_008236 [Pleurotus pulmonarius]KAF4580003.1 hypothetical protein EYR36_001823 [Pleurotus pulmonarius]KAF4596947.1 hypothetical protein EYR40_007397 [Pleurotus pulmonarius]